jgi:hypothetical protein
MDIAHHDANNEKRLRIAVSTWDSFLANTTNRFTHQDIKKKRRLQVERERERNREIEKDRKRERATERQSDRAKKKKKKKKKKECFIRFPISSSYSRQHRNRTAPFLDTFIHSLS